MVPFDAEAQASHRRLVARLVAGDTEAMQLLYLEFGGIVHGVVRRVLEDPEDAREAVQDTFVKLWRQAGSYRPEKGEVVSWLVFMARHVAIDRVRQGARRRLVYEVLQKQPEETGKSPAVEIEMQDSLANDLAQLSPAQRRALELAFFAGCSQAEIASAMQTPVGNVKNHLRRGLAKLRQIVTSHD
ncbi:MAG: sigma-70 family RNA polymerase sigma factor [Nibricoccus sp.]